MPQCAQVVRWDGGRGLPSKACSHGNWDRRGPGEDLAAPIPRGRSEAWKVNAVGSTDQDLRRHLPPLFAAEQ